jgi:uncharacterized protein YegP (UPF0339 family)
MKVRVFKGDDQQFYYTRYADNGEPIDSSEGHEHEDEAAEVAAKYSPPGTEIIIDVED